MSDHDINVALLLIAAVSGLAEVAIVWLMIQDRRTSRGLPELQGERLVLAFTLSLGPLIALGLIYQLVPNPWVAIRTRIEQTYPIRLLA